MALKSIFKLMGGFAILFASCNKMKDLIKVEVPVTMNVDFVIPVVAQAGVASFGTFPLEMDIEALIRASNDKLRADNITSARFLSFEIEVNKDNRYEQDNFTAFSAINASFASGTQQEWVAFASMDKPPYPYTADIPVNEDVELKSYLQGTKFFYKVSGTALRPTAKEIKCKAKVRFLVKAGLQ